MTFIKPIYDEKDANIKLQHQDNQVLNSLVGPSFCRPSILTCRQFDSGEGTIS